MEEGEEEANKTESLKRELKMVYKEEEEYDIVIPKKKNKEEEKIVTWNRSIITLGLTSFDHHIINECPSRRLHLNADDLKWAVRCKGPLKIGELQTNASGKFLRKNIQNMSNLRQLIWKYCVEDEDDEKEEDDQEKMEEDDDLITSNNGNNLTMTDYKFGSLDKLCVWMVKLRQMQQLFRLSHFCPRVTHLDLIVRGDRSEDWPISLIYLHFPHLQTLTVNLQYDWQLKHVNGVPDDQLDRRHHDPKFRDRPAYIGDLKKLRYLAMKMDVSWYTASWPNLGHVLRCGICHLKNLQEILFPPMVPTQARKILTLLADCKMMSKLEKVTFQIDRLLQGSISEDDVTSLTQEFQNSFVLSVDKIPIQFYPTPAP